MINRISCIQAQPNRMQTQNKQAKPVFGSASYSNDNPLLPKSGIYVELNPKQEDEVITSLTNKISKDNLKLTKVDSEYNFFKSQKGDTLEMPLKKSDSSFISWTSEDDNERIFIKKNDPTVEIVNKSYTLLEETLDKIK